MHKKNNSNQNWWDNNPMTYENWNLSKNKRSLINKAKIKKINLDYIKNNPYLNYYFKSLKRYKHKNTVLDIGCGWGSSTVILSKLFKKVYSIDISKKSILATKKNVSLNGFQKRVNLKKFDAEMLNFTDYFNLVYSWGVIHHSYNTNKILENIYKGLKKNGKCLIMIYNKNSLRYYLKGLYYLIFKFKIFSGYNLDSVQKFFTDGFYQKHYTKSELRKILKKIGFRNISFDLTHMNKSYLSFTKNNSLIDKFFKKNFGWLLVAKFSK